MPFWKKTFSIPSFFSTLSCRGIHLYSCGINAPYYRNVVSSNSAAKLYLDAAAKLSALMKLQLFRRFKPITISLRAKYITQIAMQPSAYTTEPYFLRDISLKNCSEEFGKIKEIPYEWLCTRKMYVSYISKLHFMGIEMLLWNLFMMMCSHFKT